LAASTPETPADYAARLRAAMDPGTPAAELAELAHHHEELRPLVAANPTAYPGLLEWLGSLGDAAIDAAIASRPATPAAASAEGVVPPPPPPPPGAATPARRSFAELIGSLRRPATATDDPAAAASRRRKTIGIVAGATAAILVIVGGAVAANLLLTGGGSSATASASAFPASTYSWAEVAIDPSIEQKIGAAGVLQNLRELKDFVDDEGPDIDYDEPDLKRSLWEFIFDNPDFDRESSLDYADDIEPWLGSRVAAGLVGAAPDPTSSPMLAIEARDVERGVDAVVDTIEDLGIDGLQVSAMNGYVLVSDADLDLEAVYRDGTLNAAPGFSAASSRLGGWGLGAFWTNPHAASAAALGWFTSEDNPDSVLSLTYWENRYESDVQYWKDEIEQYRKDCPPSASYLTDYCIEYYPDSAADFEEYNGYAPDDWKAAAKKSWQDAKEDNARVVDSAERVLDDVPADASVSGVVRIVDESVELVVQSTGLRLPQFESPEHTTAIADLPAGTMAAASVSQFGSIIDTALSPEYWARGWALNNGMAFGSGWYALGSLVTYDGVSYPEFVEDGRDDFLDRIEDIWGLRIPDELSAAAGTQILVALDSDTGCPLPDLAWGEGGCSDPRAGFLVFSRDTGDTVDALDDIVDNIEGEYGAGIALDEGEGTVVIGRGDYAAGLVEADGGLGQDPRFQRVLPDLGSAFAAAYIDAPAAVDEVRDQAGYYTDTPGDAYDYFDGLSAVGLTASKAGDGDITIRLRILTGKDRP